MPVPWKNAGCRPLWRSGAVAAKPPILRSRQRPSIRVRRCWDGGSPPASQVIDQVRGQQTAAQSEQEVDRALQLAERLPAAAVGLFGKTGWSAVTSEDAIEPLGPVGDVLARSA